VDLLIGSVRSVLSGKGILNFRENTWQSVMRPDSSANSLIVSQRRRIAHNMSSLITYTSFCQKSYASSCSGMSEEALDENCVKKS
jgi:hypothetical protein